MSSYTVTPESVQSLLVTAATVKEYKEKSKAEYEKLLEAYASCKNGLGAHSEEILKLLMEAKTDIDAGSVLLDRLSFKLSKAAALRQAHIDTDNYRKSGAGAVATGIAAGAAVGGAVGAAAGAVSGGGVSAGASHSKSGQLSDGELPYEQKVAWVEKMVPGWSKKEAERAVGEMEIYSGWGYDEVHKDSEGKLQTTQDILTIMDSPNTPVYNGTIYRGVSFSSKEALMDALKRSPGVWKEPGITSFSSDWTVADGFASQKDWGLVLTCDDNKTGIPFKHISQLSHEDEVLSPGGHRVPGWSYNPQDVTIDNARKKVFIRVHEM